MTTYKLNQTPTEEEVRDKKSLFIKWIVVFLESNTPFTCVGNFISPFQIVFFFSIFSQWYSFFYCWYLGFCRNTLLETFHSFRNFRYQFIAWLSCLLHINPKLQRLLFVVVDIWLSYFWKEVQLSALHSYRSEKAHLEIKFSLEPSLVVNNA